MDYGIVVRVVNSGGRVVDMTDMLMTIGAAQQAMVNERDKRIKLEAKYEALLARVEALG